MQTVELLVDCAFGSDRRIVPSSCSYAHPPNDGSPAPGTHADSEAARTEERTGNRAESRPTLRQVSCLWAHEVGHHGSA
jgi:hypothetical protein